MNIYIDESGSINNELPEGRDFVITLIKINEKDKVWRIHKRFVSSNLDRLRQLDDNARNPGKMFFNGDFKELKGSQFDPAMKHKFVEYFSRNSLFEIYYIQIHNHKLKNRLCSNTARAFNYTLKLALDFFISNGYLPDEDYVLQIDERNERTETKHFLETYLNTELHMSNKAEGDFQVHYFDSCNNRGIQIADVFSNLYYSSLFTDEYKQDLENLRQKGILKYVFQFPL